MQLLDWLVVVLGLALALAVLVDVSLNVLHPDAEGKIAYAVQRGVWRVAVAAGRRWETGRRRLLAAAGPLMVVLTLIVWVALFVLAVTLVVWPNLHDFRTEDEFADLGFLDALYYAGVTVTVLGYGDITPLRGPMQVVAFVASGAGFALLTGIVTYLVQLVESLSRRNRLALAVLAGSGGSGRGAALPIRYLRSDSVQELSQRYVEWSDLTNVVQDDLHRLAISSLFQRSRDAAYDPEPAFRILGEAIAAGYLVVDTPAWASVRPAVEELDVAHGRLARVLAQQYLGSEVTRALARREPERSDRAWLAAMERELSEALGEHGRAEPAESSRQEALLVGYRHRVLLQALASFTHWGPEHGPLPVAE